jgi:hypothetical protein
VSVAVRSVHARRAVDRSAALWRDTRSRAEEDAMGDKGGKKDKEKNKQQHDTKRKEQQKQKDDKRKPKAP